MLLSLTLLFLDQTQRVSVIQSLRCLSPASTKHGEGLILLITDLKCQLTLSSYRGNGLDREKASCPKPNTKDEKTETQGKKNESGSLRLQGAEPGPNPHSPDISQGQLCPAAGGKRPDLPGEGAQTI